MMEDVKISIDEYSGIDVDDLIDKLKEIKANSNGAKLKIETHLNYSQCYYEGDTPSIDIIVKAS